MARAFRGVGLGVFAFPMILYTPCPSDSQEKRFKRFAKIALATPRESGYNVGVANERARTMSKKASIPAAVKAAMFARFDCCAACGTWDADECGHIVAESKGGEVSIDNLVRLCGSCNRKQANRSVVFGGFATLTESRALIQSRRAYWEKYLGASRIAKPYKPVA